MQEAQVTIDGKRVWVYRGITLKARADQESCEVKRNCAVDYKALQAQP
jgi:hypothetical protein